MSLKGKISQLILTSGLAYGVLTGINAYNHHNIEIEDRGDKTFQKIDGALSHTILKFTTHAIALNRCSAMNYRTFTDNNSDGKVDRVFLGGNPFLRGFSCQSFYRETDLKDYSPIFEQADKELAEQLDRFGLDYKGNRLD